MSSNPLPSHPHDALDDALTRTLETPPAPAIPTGFAARVALQAAQLPAPSPRRIRSYATLTAWSALGALLCVMLLLAALFPGRAEWLQLTLGSEFILLAATLGLRPTPERL